MEDVASNLTSEEQSSFGIKKIVDCKIGEGGRQMYKVKWEPTWEPAENLASCQHLIDEFWSFVNKAKTNEEVAQQHRKRMRLEQGNNVMNIDQNFDRMSDDNKAEVQRLIASANATSVGSLMLMSPSNLLMASAQRNEQNNIMGMARTPTHANNQNFPNSPQTPQNMRQQNAGMQMPTSGQKSLNFGSPQQQHQLDSPGQKGKLGAFGNKGNAPTPPTKVEADDSTKINVNCKESNDISMITNWTNPYVTVHFKCRICQKELPKATYWKKHYSFHTDGPKFPCSMCGKSFKQQCDLRRHEKNIHKTAPNDGQMTRNDNEMKSEPF